MSNDQYPTDQFGQNPQTQPSAAPVENAWQQASTPEYTGQIPQGNYYGQPAAQAEAWQQSAPEYTGQIPQGNYYGQQQAYGQPEMAGQMPPMGYQQQFPQQPAQPGPFSVLGDMKFTQVTTKRIAGFTWLMIIIASCWAWLVRVLTYFANLKTIVTRTSDMKKSDDISTWALLGGIGEAIIGLATVAAVIWGSRIVLEFLVRWHEDKDAAKQAETN